MRDVLEGIIIGLIVLVLVVCGMGVINLALTGIAWLVGWLA